jgi:hypothetical protein
MKCFILIQPNHRFAFLQKDFVSKIATTLRQRSFAASSQTSRRPMLSTNARRSYRFPCISTSQEKTVSSNEGVQLEEVLSLVDIELSKQRPDVPHLEVLNRHIFSVDNLPYVEIPSRLSLSSTLVSFLCENPMHVSNTR